MDNHPLSTVAQVIEAARALGVQMCVQNGRLDLTAPAEPPADLLQELVMHKAEIIAFLRQPKSTWDEPDRQADYDERAAIMEFDGGLNRAEAEKLARSAMPTLNSEKD